MLFEAKLYVLVLVEAGLDVLLHDQVIVVLVRLVVDVCRLRNHQFRDGAVFCSRI